MHTLSWGESADCLLSFEIWDQPSDSFISTKHPLLIISQGQEEWEPKLCHRTEVLDVLLDTQYEYHDSTQEHWYK